MTNSRVLEVLWFKRTQYIVQLQYNNHGNKCIHVYTCDQVHLCFYWQSVLQKLWFLRVGNIVWRTISLYTHAHSLDHIWTRPRWFIVVNVEVQHASCIWGKVFWMLKSVWQNDYQNAKQGNVQCVKVELQVHKNIAVNCDINMKTEVMWICAHLCKEKQCTQCGSETKF